MYVVAQVDETNISRVRLGQRATITSGGFSGQLRGTVSQIDLQISQKDVFSSTRTSDLNVRVVEVKIRLNPTDSERVKALSNLQVEVAINI